MTDDATTTGPPDFIGVGTQRSGTTWWFETLLGHPRIRPPRGRRKELHFFDRFGAEEMTQAHVEEYATLFRRRPGQIAGEWTPRYMGDAWALRLIKRAAPDTRILVLLRDPIERGRYGTQLKRLHELFDEEQILVLQYERCVLDPVGQYRRTLEHLRVDDHVPDDVSSLRGQSMAAQKTDLWPELIEGLKLTLDPEVRTVCELVPDVDLGLWPNFA